MKTVGTQTEPKPTPGEIISDDKLNGWITSMKKMLNTVNDDRAKASSISNVPEQLKKSGAEAYMPKVVSIGPLHRGGSRKELLSMEDIKWRCMLSLFQRTVNPKDSHRNCSERMFMLDGVVRATYANEIKFDAYDLAKIMLLDGCFLLELLISNNPKLDQNYKKIKQTEKKSPGAEIGKMQLVLSDLKLLENQVPIFILIMLFRWLFGHSLTPAEKTFEAVRKTVNDGAQFLFGCNSNSIPAKNPPAAHFLELLHWSMTWEVDAIDQATGEEDAIDLENNDPRSITVEDAIDLENNDHRSIAVEDAIDQATGEEDAIDQENNDHRSITVEVAIDQENNDHRSQLQCCATRLEAAGVKIESFKAQSKSIKPVIGLREGSRIVKWYGILRTRIRTLNALLSFFPSPRPLTNCTRDKKNKKPVVGKKKIIFGCDIKSEGTLEKEKEIKSEGKLLIQPLYITETTEVLWRNLIAWEQNRIVHENFLKEENRTRCKFSQYALLFNDLVCCEHDIQLLKDRGVLSVEDGDRRSNEDLMKLFRNVAKEIQIDASGDARFAQVQLIDARGYCKIFWHLCRCIVTNIRYKCRNLYGLLKHDHIPTPWKTTGLIAAIVLLCLTIAQTIFGAIQL